MNFFLVFIIVLFSSSKLFSQEINGNELLEKAIQYHDPQGNWNSFSGTLFISMETPKKPPRNSEIKIDLPKQYFYVKAYQNQKTTEYTLKEGVCEIQFNGKTPTEEELTSNNLSCDRALMYNNYYSYLYGLPMKLKDSGTIIHQKVRRKKLKEKEYLVLKVSYKKEVGKDTWYFYFNPWTYAMERYQFYHHEEKNDGEYILLSGLETINGIKMPKKRDWFYNKNNQFLGTDLLSLKE